MKANSKANFRKKILQNIFFKIYAGDYDFKMQNKRNVFYFLS